jgi:putative transposase
VTDSIHSAAEAVEVDSAGVESAMEPVVSEDLARRLVEQARTEGLSLIGPGGLLGDLTKKVLETSLEVEMTDHLGYDRHAPEGRNRGNSRNGKRSKTVITEVGPIDVEVPRDRDASFESVIVRKGQRRLEGIEPLVLSLSAKGLTYGEISAHVADVYGASVSKDTIGRITDTVLAEISDWQNRPLDRVYPVLFVDVIFVKIRDGQVTNRPIYVVIGVTVEEVRDIVGLWAARWRRRQILGRRADRGAQPRRRGRVHRGVRRTQRGLPEAIASVWPAAIVQTCILHLVRHTFRLAARQDWDRIAKALRPIYTAPTEAAARRALDELADTWGKRYPAIARLWESSWAEFVPFLAFDVEVRRVVCSTNAIESLNARIRRAVRARGHFPTEQAALKCLYLALRALDPTGRGRARWITRWKPALNAFALTFEGRIIPTNNN